MSQKLPSPMPADAVRPTLPPLSEVLHPLTFKEFSNTSLKRVCRWHRGGLAEWSVADWAVAFAGEAGEVCDVVKKMNRLRDAVPSQNPTQPKDMEYATHLLAKEIGDAYCYLDLLAQRAGLSMEACVRLAFNSVSEREGFPERV